MGNRRWETPTPPEKSENNNTASNSSDSHTDPPVDSGLIDIGCRKEGFNIEFGKAGNTLPLKMGEFPIEDAEKDIPYYKNYFFNLSK